MAVDPVSVTLASMQLASAAAPIIGPMISGKAEKAMRKDALAEHEALQRSAGSGFTQGQRQAFRAEAAGQRDAQAQQQLAALARGSATGAGESGQAQAGARDVFRAKVGAANAAESQIRAQDLQAHMAKKIANQNALANIYNMGQKRRAEILTNQYDASGSMGQSIGELARMARAKKVTEETPNPAAGMLTDEVTPGAQTP